MYDCDVNFLKDEIYQYIKPGEINLRNLRTVTYCMVPCSLAIASNVASSKYLLTLTSY